MIDVNKLFSVFVVSELNVGCDFFDEVFLILKDVFKVFFLWKCGFVLEEEM